jgi:hypothetical protein
MWLVLGRREMYTGFLGESGGRSPLQRPEYRWENDIKMDLKEIGWGNVDWINLALG